MRYNIHFPKGKTLRQLFIIGFGFFLTQCKNRTDIPIDNSMTLKVHPTIALGFVFGWNQTNTEKYFYSLIKNKTIAEDSFEIDAMMNWWNKEKPACKSVFWPVNVTLIDGVKFDVKPMYFNRSYLSDSNIFYQLVLKSEGFVIDKSYDPYGEQTGLSKLEAKHDSLKQLLIEKYKSPELEDSGIVFLQNKIRVRVDSDIETFDLLTCSYSSFNKRVETIKKQMGRLIITYTDIDMEKQISILDENQKRNNKVKADEANKRKL